MITNVHTQINSWKCITRQYHEKKTNIKADHFSLNVFFHFSFPIKEFTSVKGGFTLCFTLYSTNINNYPPKALFFLIQFSFQEDFTVISMV
jgi:hypothetical protein